MAADGKSKVDSLKAVVDNERLGAGRWLNDDGLPEGGGVVTQHQAGGIGDPRQENVACLFFSLPVWKNITNSPV